MQFDLATVTDVLQIIFADIILSGDNALVIGMAAAGLAANQRKKAIAIGMAMAAGMRILFAIIATYLLAIKGILLIGGLLLSWVCWRFYLDLKAFNQASIDAIESSETGAVSGGGEKSEKAFGGRWSRFWWLIYPCRLITSSLLPPLRVTILNC